ncbi:MAG: hypothetical protein JWO92_480 [Chitinophagaceae bacterium]|nr:hypothetical protein [Chitinophagaceae bacterium]
MENKGLIFIPDISGFTHFVNSVELDHSQHIIHELLEIILEANQMDLNISEIEGDAILFYKFGALPDLSLAYEQVEKMFLAFHKHLEFYERRRTCHCNACISVINLTLKVITHYGEFKEYKIRNFRKLIGKDIIIAHQLLKNNISNHEYWLITNSLSENTPNIIKPWMQWNKGIKQVNQTEISFHFVQLWPLKEK